MSKAHLTPEVSRNAPFRVAVVSCYDYAWATVRELSQLDGVSVVGFLEGDPPRPRLPVRVRRLWRAHGRGIVLAAVSSIARKLGRSLGTGVSTNAVPGVPHIHLGSLNAPDSIAALQSLQPDLMVVDGASILKPSFFSVPRHGSINLHCGKLPDYRGMPPAFWELYHGDPEVGVSIHAVSARLDEGAVYAASTVPLDLIPPGDPVAFATTFWRERLRPVGIKLLAQTVRAIADGTAAPTPQPPASRPPFRTPSAQEKRELRRRVAQRRAERP